MTSVMGLGAATRDCITVADDARIAELLRAWPAPGLVQLEITDDARAAHRRFHRENGGGGWSAGGTVANTLCSVAAAGAQAAARLAVSWSGPAEYVDSPLADAALAHLREWGVRVHPVYDPAFTREAHCIVDAATGDVRRIAIHERGFRLAGQPHWMPCDVVVVTLADLLRCDDAARDYVGRCGTVALLMADWRPSAGLPGMDVVLRRHPNLGFVFGDQPDYEAAGVFDARTEAFHPLLRAVECVATNGPGSVRWKGAGTDRGTSFDVDVATGFSGNLLGAGDGYAGAFLAGRIGGAPAEEAHQAGMAQARQVMESTLSYARRGTDLNRVFPASIDRRSGSATEGEWAARMRMSPGLVVTCCGQTGIDQLAGQTAKELGLAAFAVMPQGRRTEWSELGLGAPDQLAGVTVLELASPSYRFCTWANVFLSDGTLLLDYTGSEGSEETRKAAAWLGRPVLELAGMDAESAASRVAEWVDRHGVRVVNCAGNRRSLLGPAADAHSRAVMRAALLSAAATVARRDASLPRGRADAQPLPAAGWEPVALAVPNSALWRRVVAGMLRDMGVVGADEAAELAASKALSWRAPSGAIELLFGRARDLPMALRRGWIGYAIFGLDLWLDDGDGVEPLFPTGVDPCSLVVVAPDRDVDQDGARPRTLASAWPQLARTLIERGRFGDAEFVRVLGSVEGWLHTGRLDLALDTYQSGRTVQENALRVTGRLGTAHTWLFRRADSAAPHPLASAIAGWLHGSADVLGKASASDIASRFYDGPDV